LNVKMNFELQVEVPLHIKDAESEQDQPILRFIGVGYRKDKLGATSPMLFKTQHEKQLIPNEQLIFLKDQVLIFGHSFKTLIVSFFLLN